MTYHDTPFRAARAPLAAGGQGLRRLPRRMLELLRVWQQRAEERRALARMEPHMLHDIGVSEATARREADKPFWRA